MSDSPSLDSEYLDPVALTQRLVRFDTTNPSGNEGECIAHIKSVLDGAGIQNQVLAKTPGRPNLIARLPGDGSAAPYCSRATPMWCRPIRPVGSNRRSVATLLTEYFGAGARWT